MSTAETAPDSGRPSASGRTAPFALVAAVALLAFYLTRALVALSAGDALVFLEEHYIGLVALRLFSAPLAELFAQQLTPYNGGSLVLAVPVAVLFRAFGPSIMLAKAVPLFLAGINLLVWLRLVWNVFGSRATWLFAGLFVLSPPVFSQTAALLWGTHLEGQVFLAAALWLAFGLAERQGEAPDWRAFLLGFCLGFGFYFSNGNLLAAVLAGAVLLLGDRLFFFRRPGALVLAGALVGLIPWLMHNYFTAGAPLKWLAASSGGVPWRQALDKVLLHVTTYYPASFGFQVPFGGVGPALNIAYGVLGAAALVFLLLRRLGTLFCLPRELFRRHTPPETCRALGELLPLAYFLLFFAALGASRFEVQPDPAIARPCYALRYLVHSQTLLFLALALALDELLESRFAPVRVIGRAVAGGLLVLGLAAMLALVSPAGMQKGFREPDWQMKKEGLILRKAPRPGAPPAAGGEGPVLPERRPAGS